MSLAFKVARALVSFLCCERSLRDSAATPVGRWVYRTPDSVLFWCWPPGPPERNTSRFSSSSRSTMSIVSSTSGRTSTDANEVCRRALESNGLIRTRRWTPVSPLR